ncbi:mitochondrial RNA helicase [Cryptococcus neoformans c8]|nr:mitochondrial RNA helicase [Cryptococcus neoformans var. grubii c8]
MSHKMIIRQLARVTYIRPICTQCRQLSIASRLLRQYIPRSERQDSSRSNRKQQGKRPFAYTQREPVQLTIDDFKPKTPPKASFLIRSMLQRLPEWATSSRAMVRLKTYGLEASLVRELSKEWLHGVKSSLSGITSEEEAKAALERGGWDPEGLLIAISEDRFMSTLESLALRQFLTSILPSSLLSSAQKSHISSILSATDLTRLIHSTDFLPSRAIKRHFHLHIGPTNSGKTYNALKALSIATTGAYAGPLRLLAHEVWERMNLGSVGGLDGKGRECNLLTGEERRVVHPDARLLSCTVEMLPLAGLSGTGFDVVVIDEIQMLGDGQRGGAWTKAVLGVAAKEIHLCGDETTVDLLRGMIAFLGDDLTVHQYNRLTPLSVANESLKNDYTKVEDGDCIVTFSRSNIFEVKKQVESQAGKKCAVVYGALPPETRAEQARDFNDEDGASKVLVASDAVGMGLNLKIRRIIFESLSKFNGKSQVPLSLMQIKQIAGRAGRFKTGNDLTKISNISAPDEAPAAGGIATTLAKDDLPILKELMTWSLPSISRAKLEIPTSGLVQLSTLLPASTTYAELLSHFSALAKPPSSTIIAAHDHKLPLAELVEPFRDRLSLGEMDLFCFAPVNTRDERAKEIFVNLIEDYAEEGCVLIDNIFEGLQTNMLDTLDQVHEILVTLPPMPPPGQAGSKKASIPPFIINSLPVLETLHKTLVLYIWLSFRLEVAFPDRPKAVEYKVKCEGVLEDCLERMPGLKPSKKAKSAVSKKTLKELEEEKQRRKQEEDEKKKIEWRSGSEVKKEQSKKMWKNLALTGDGEGGKET